MLLDDELYYRTIDGVLLGCVSSDESKSLMGEIRSVWSASIGFQDEVGD